MKKMLLVFFCFIILNCYTQEMTEDSLHISKINNVLIATSKGDFKQTIVDKITARTDELNCTFKIVKLRELNDETFENYDAIIILNSIKVGRMNKHVRKFFKNLYEAHRKKIILVNTAKKDWKSKEDGIYAITSASKMEYTEAMTDSVTNQLKRILNK